MKTKYAYPAVFTNVAAEKEHVNFSGLLQEALKERLTDSDYARQ